MNEFGSTGVIDDERRAEALAKDRELEEAPLPGADQSHYSDEGQRQSALGQAEKANIARSAGEIGLTSDEWLALRKSLGRSPTFRDVPEK